MDGDPRPSTGWGSENVENMENKIITKKVSGTWYAYIPWAPDLALGMGTTRSEAIRDFRSRDNKTIRRMRSGINATLRKFQPRRMGFCIPKPTVED